MTSNRTATRAAAVLGALAVLAIPAGALLASRWGKVTLLQSLWVSVPLAALLGLVAVAVARRARFAAAASVRPDAAKGLRLARFLAWTGVYAGVTGGLALAVYAGLRLLQ